jgi:glycosyltransferase involved in cell wall biosynthesis
VPVFNGQQTLAACLNSILDQLDERGEVVVVDDGSTDNSLRIARTKAAEDSRLTVVHQRNRGLGAARNRGAARARGLFLAFVDADDVVLPGTYRAALAALGDPEVDLVCFELVHGRDKGLIHPLWARYIHDHNRPSVNLSQFPALLRDFYTPNMVFRLATWRQLGASFREGTLFEDQPLITQLFCQARKIAVLRHPGYVWQRPPGLQTLTSSTLHNPEALHARVVATDLTRQVIEKQNNPTVQAAWYYTMIENHLLNTYLRHVDKLAQPVLEHLSDLVKAAGSVKQVTAPPVISPAAAIFADLLCNGATWAVGRLAAAGWASNQRDWLRGAYGKAALAAALADPPAFGKVPALDLNHYFEGRQPDPQRLVVRLSKVAWLPNGALELHGRIAMLAGFARNSVTVSAKLLGPHDTTGAVATAQLRKLTADEKSSKDTWPKTLRQQGELTAFSVRFDDVASLPSSSKTVSYPLEIAVTLPGGCPVGPGGFAVAATGWHGATQTVVRPAAYPNAEQRHCPTNPAIFWRIKDRHWLEVIRRPDARMVWIPTSATDGCQPDSQMV